MVDGSRCSVAGPVEHARRRPWPAEHHVVDRELELSGSTPDAHVSDACGSRSTTSTRLPRSTSARPARGRTSSWRRRPSGWRRQSSAHRLSVARRPRPCVRIGADPRFGRRRRAPVTSAIERAAQRRPSGLAAQMRRMPRPSSVRRPTVSSDHSPSSHDAAQRRIAPWSQTRPSTAPETLLTPSEVAASVPGEPQDRHPLGTGRQAQRHPHARRPPPLPGVGDPALPRGDVLRAAGARV